ncbi:MAG: PHP domain-containing protein [Planctomycetaceae bacterium]|nr:PHP domain-containing protein [Planctomycetaceae bacterium]
MSDRRQFLKQLALFGAVAASPVSFVLGQTEPQTVPLVDPSDGLFAVSHRHITRTKTPRQITIPDAGEFKVLKGDFHIHTLFSDGLVMPKDRVAEAVDNGLDVIAITDHIEYRPNLGGSIKLLDRNDDHNIAYDIAKPEADKQNLILVRGTEITKSEWHFNALFANDINPIAAVVDDWRAMIATAADQGAFVHWNHPNWVDRTPDTAPFGLKSGEPLRFFDEIEEVRAKGQLHGIEVFNGSTYYPVVSQWCEERNLAMNCNSDIHASEWNQYGHQNPLRPMTLILAKERSHDAVREAFFAKRTIAFAAGMVIGQREWLEKLFRACVTLTTKPGLLELANNSDIPCLVQAGGTVRELPAQGQLTMYRSDSLKKLTVSNWLACTNQPLEIALG